jgi:hypothetical protein
MEYDENKGFQNGVGMAMSTLGKRVSGQDESLTTLTGRMNGQPRLRHGLEAVGGGGSSMYGFPPMEECVPPPVEEWSGALFSRGREGA